MPGGDPVHQAGVADGLGQGFQFSSPGAAPAKVDELLVQGNVPAQSGQALVEECVLAVLLELRREPRGAPDGDRPVLPVPRNRLDAPVLGQ